MTIHLYRTSSTSLVNTQENMFPKTVDIILQMSPSSFGDGIKGYPSSYSPRSSILQPGYQVLALTNIKPLQFLTPFYDCLDSYTRYPNAASDGKFTKFKQVEAYTSKGRIGNGTATKG